jgi:anthranilate phosphoribosyltransferase
MTLDLLHHVAQGGVLTDLEAETAMQSLLTGQSTPVLTAAFLTALRVRGESVEELTGFARAMRAAALPIRLEPECRPLLDTCGTGGNLASSFNISTVAAFVVAGAGVRVAKHGNRSITSKCGSADILEALGVNTKATPEVVAHAIHESGIGFLFAPAFHSATRHVQPVRLELKFRTAFNYLGPLTNPALPEFQVSGTWSVDAAEKIAGALVRLGLKRGFVVHASDGLGEVTITGPSTVFVIDQGALHQTQVTPEDFGYDPRPFESIRGGDAEFNRAVAESIFAGEHGARREIVVINAAMALVAAGKARDYREGVQRAIESIDSGAARARLDQLRAAASLSMAGSR